MKHKRKYSKQNKKEIFCLERSAPQACPVECEAYSTGVKRSLSEALLTPHCLLFTRY
jgi:hypothetical protein